MTNKTLRALVREILLSEVDVDPPNNPGRPADSYDYVGMRPKHGQAMAHPALTGDKLVDVSATSSSTTSTNSATSSSETPPD